jgi:hypothetical protein
LGVPHIGQAIKPEAAPVLDSEGSKVQPQLSQNVALGWTGALHCGHFVCIFNLLC